MLVTTDSPRGRGTPRTLGLGKGYKPADTSVTPSAGMASGMRTARVLRCTAERRTADGEAVRPPAEKPGRVERRLLRKLRSATVEVSSESTLRSRVVDVGADNVRYFS